MHNKNNKNVNFSSFLAISILIGLIIAGGILFFNFYTNGEHLIFLKLSQGEVLVGIVIAFPMLITWVNL